MIYLIYYIGQSLHFNTFLYDRSRDEKNKKERIAMSLFFVKSVMSGSKTSGLACLEYLFYDNK